MLHILWIILKIILIVFAVILGLILLLLLVLLFCPLCYSAYGARDDSGIRGRVRVHWLFHAVSAQAIYEGEKGSIAVKVLGIPIEKLQSFFGRFQKKKQESIQRDSSEADDPVMQEDSGTQIKKIETEQKDDTLTFEAEPLETADSDGAVSRILSRVGDVWRRITGFIIRIFRTFLKVVRFLFHLPGRIVGFFSKISLTFTGICDKITRWKDLLDEETSRVALSLVWGKGKKLLRHVFPQKLEGHITFGLENPAATGQVLAVIGATCPIHKNAIAVTPVFDEEILEGEVSLRGRIYFVALVKLAVEVYFNKDIKAFLKSIKQMEG